jgi:GTP-binding protein
VLLLDATLGLEAQDLRIADMVLSEGRALVIALNKWDVAHDQSSLFQGVRKALDDGLSQIRGVPLVAISGQTGRGLDIMMKAVTEAREKWSRRVSTAAINRWFESALDRNPPPAAGGTRIKLRYVTQVAARPPTFIIFGNRTEDLPSSYGRYLINSLRDDLDFEGVPIRLNFRGGKNPFENAPRGKPGGSKSASKRPGAAKSGGKAVAKVGPRRLAPKAGGPKPGGPRPSGQRTGKR